MVVLESTGARYLSLYGSRYPTTPHLAAEAAHAVVYDRVLRARRLHRERAGRAHPLHAPVHDLARVHAGVPGLPGRTVRRRAEGAAATAPRSCRRRFLDYVNVRTASCAAAATTRCAGSKDLGAGRRPQLVGRQRRGRSSTARWSGSTATARARSTRPSGRSRPTTPTTRVPGHDPIRLLRRRTAAARRLRPRPLPERGGRSVDRQLGAALRGAARARPGRRDARGRDGRPRRGVRRSPRRPGATASGSTTRACGSRSMLWSPALFPQGRRDDTVGGHVDVGPDGRSTCSASTRRRQWEGRSLFAPGRPPRAYFYAANDDYLLGVREGDLKYVYNATPRPRPAVRPRARPDEPRTWPRAHPEVCRRLRQRLAAWKHHAASRLSESARAARAGRRRGSRQADGAAPIGARRRLRVDLASGHAARMTWRGAGRYALSGGERCSPCWRRARGATPGSATSGSTRPPSASWPPARSTRRTRCSATTTRSPSSLRTRSSLGLVAGSAGSRRSTSWSAQGLVNLALLGAALYAFVATWVRRPAGGFYVAPLRAVPLGPRALALTAASSTCAASPTCFRIRRPSRRPWRSATLAAFSRLADGRGRGSLVVRGGRALFGRASR